MTFSDLATSGGAVQVTDATANSGFDGPLLHRGIDAVANTTLWGSYLFSRPQGVPPVNQTIGEINTANGATDGFGAARFRTLAEAFGATPQAGMSLSGGGEALGSYPADYFTDPATYTDPLLIVSKVTDVGGATGASTLATVWALNAAGFDSIKAGGVTEAELTSVAIATATDTTTISATHTFDATSFLRITTLRNGAWGVFDEIRYGVGADPTEAGILPVSAIPEPSSIALLGCCLAGIGRRRLRASSV
ncbi:PEP-CTERM sorting domain-containing protein [Pirellulimonas nuda]|uniref:PEP-CTERM sorting domain-containing protein n=1 Tax=Pirellulimonas nuda TaxID=2528009 RepID=UPI0018D3B792|nr:PEP-CTERM sorting domain-containing protein [Pirellulimonas nuda]